VPHLPAASPAIARSDGTSLLISGRSLRGRPIIAFHTGSASAPPVLVFGAIHGNETAGIAIADALLDGPVAPDADIWVVPDLNPDGVALDRRQNGDGIDLNRNFPFRWSPIATDGPFDYPGPRAASEPETRFAIRVIRTVHPRITIWFHQHLRVVDISGGSRAVEARFSQLVGLPLRRLTRYPGSAPTWQNHTFPGTTSFVVELPAGTLGAPAVARYVDAIVDLATADGT
jgi:murein peptide amidase A